MKTVIFIFDSAVVIIIINPVKWFNEVSGDSGFTIITILKKLRTAAHQNKRFEGISINQIHRDAPCFLTLQAARRGKFIRQNLKPSAGI